MTPTGLWKSKRNECIQEIHKISPCSRYNRSSLLCQMLTHHMSVAVEMGVWLTISGATYSGVPYLQ